MSDIPDIIDRLLAAVKADAPIQRALVVSAAAEIERLRFAIRRLAEQDATLSVCEGNVTVTMDATLTDAAREAIEFMLRHAAYAADIPAFADSGDYRLHHDTLFVRLK